MDEKASTEHDARTDRPLEHSGKLPFRECWPPFAKVWRGLINTDLPSAIAAELSTTTQTVRHWRSGNAGIPTWVIKKTSQRVLERYESAMQALAMITPGPGRNGDIVQRIKKARRSGRA